MWVRIPFCVFQIINWRGFVESYLRLFVPDERGVAIFIKVEILPCNKKKFDMEKNLIVYSSQP